MFLIQDMNSHPLFALDKCNKAKVRIYALPYQMLLLYQKNTNKSNHYGHEYLKWSFTYKQYARGPPQNHS